MKALQGLGSEQQSFILMPLLWCEGIHPPGKRRMHLTMGHQRDPEPQSLPSQEQLWHEGCSGSLGAWGQSSEANSEQPGHIQPLLGAAWSWEASIHLGCCRSCRDGIGAEAICCWPPASHLSLGPARGLWVSSIHPTTGSSPWEEEVAACWEPSALVMVGLHLSSCSPSSSGLSDPLEGLPQLVLSSSAGAMQRDAGIQGC